MTTKTYIYGWKNNPKRQVLYGERCRVLAWGKMNSVLVIFKDGSREIISRRALKSVNLEGRMDNKECLKCDGKGYCLTCNGYGYVKLQARKECPECSGSGSCPECDGYGYLKWRTRYLMRRMRRRQE